MKRLLALMLLVCLLLPVCAVAEGELTARDINSTDAFAFSLWRVAMPKAPDTEEYKYYYVQQGACTDGTYAYTILENQKINRDAIWKMDLRDWSLVKAEYNLPLDHANDITYNPVLNQLIVANNKPNYTRLSFVDPDTLQVVGTRELPYKMYAISYEPTRDQYVIGVSGTYDFVILDSNFETVAYHKGVDTGFTKQNVDSDENYVYFPQWKRGATGNVVMVYDWEGNYVNQIRVKSYQEIESMFHTGDDWYIAFYDKRCSYIFEATLEYDTRKIYQQKMGK